MRLTKQALHQKLNDSRKLTEKMFIPIFNEFHWYLGHFNIQNWTM